MPCNRLDRRPTNHHRDHTHGTPIFGEAPRTLDCVDALDPRVVSSYAAPTAPRIVGARGGRPSVGTVASGPGLRRLGSWMGIAFVVLFVAGFLLFNTPNKGTDTAKWANWWNDSGNRTTAVIAVYLIVLGLIAFVWF